MGKLRIEKPPFSDKEQMLWDYIVKERLNDQSMRFTSDVTARAAEELDTSPVYIGELVRKLESRGLLIREKLIGEVGYQLIFIDLDTQSAVGSTESKQAKAFGKMTVYELISQLRDEINNLQKQIVKKKKLLELLEAEVD